MSPLSWFIVLLSASKANSNFKSDIRCPLCGECYRICRNGHYWRYRFEDDRHIAVQRYFCRNPDCLRKTFSVLPFPCLPFCRIPLCTLMVLYHEYTVHKRIVSQCARRLNRSWNTAKRALTTAARILDWFTHESGAGAIPIIPCLTHAWAAFTRAYSYAFFPDRR